MARKTSPIADPQTVGKILIWGSAALWLYEIGLFIILPYFLIGMILYIVFELAALKQRQGKLLWAVRTVAILVPISIFILLRSIHVAFATADSYPLVGNTLNDTILTVITYLPAALLILLGILTMMNSSMTAGRPKRQHRQ